MKSGEGARHDSPKPPSGGSPRRPTCLRPAAGRGYSPWHHLSWSMPWPPSGPGLRTPKPTTRRRMTTPGSQTTAIAGSPHQYRLGPASRGALSWVFWSRIGRGGGRLNRSYIYLTTICFEILYGGTSMNHRPITPSESSGSSGSTGAQPWGCDTS